MARVVGNVDLNEDRFITEYRKQFIKNWPDFLKRNPESFITLLAKKKWAEYIKKVHGPKSRASSQCLDPAKTGLKTFDGSVNEISYDFKKTFVNPSFNEKLE